MWLLNNDTTVEPRALSALVEAVVADPDAGIAGSKITYFDHPDVLWYAGGEFTPAGPVRHRGLDEPDTGQYDRPEETGFVTGCSLFTTADVIERLGLLAEEYFLYWEEADFDWRVHAAGYKLLYVPGSVVRHKVARSLGESWGTTQTEVPRAQHAAVLPPKPAGAGGRDLPEGAARRVRALRAPAVRARQGDVRGALDVHDGAVRADRELGRRRRVGRAL